MKKLIIKAGALLLAGLLLIGTIGAVGVFAAETALNLAGTGHTKSNDTTYAGTDWSIAGMGDISGHVLFFQYDISGFTPETTVNSAVWRAFHNSGQNWNLAFLKFMTFPCEKSLGSFTATHADLTKAGYVQDANMICEGQVNAVSAITFDTAVPSGETAEVGRYNVDITAAVQTAIKNGQKYFNLAIRPYAGYNALAFKTDSVPKPQLILDTVAPPAVSVTEVAPLPQGTSFDVTANVTKGDAEIAEVQIAVANAEGDAVTDYSAPVITDGNYKWSFPSTLAADSYTITVTVTDVSGFTSSDTIKVRVLGKESFAEVVADPPKQTAVTYNGEWLECPDNWKVNNSSLTSYFAYDISEYALYNLADTDGVVWGCPSNSYNGTIEFYEILSGWDEASVQNGNVPVLAEKPFATVKELSDVDMTAHTKALIEKGADTLQFAVKTSEEETLVIDRKGEDAPVLTLQMSDNQCPVIEADTNGHFSAGNDVMVSVTDDDFVTGVTATLDGVECTVEKNEEQWIVTIPTDAANGNHKLMIYAKDYSGTQTIAEYLLRVGTKIYDNHIIQVNGATATATADVLSGTPVLVIAAYKNNMLIDVTIDSIPENGNLSAAVNVADTQDVTFQSFIFGDAEDFMPLAEAICYPQ